LYELEGVLGPQVVDFVGRYVSSLLTWDILVFFHRNRDISLDLAGLAARLGRRPEEIAPEIDRLCSEHILSCTGGMIAYRPSPEVESQVAAFVDACEDRGRRLALIALVLHRIGRAPADTN
jgi:hypothetical protein